MRSVVLLVASACLALLAAAASAQEDGRAANRQAIVKAMALQLVQRQVSPDADASELEAQEVDLNHDGFPEIYAFRKLPACDGVSCGNFFFALVGDKFSETLGQIPGARSWPENSINLGIHKRNGYLDLQSGAVVVGWAGDHYADASGFPRTELNGDAFLPACEAAANEGQDASAIPNNKQICACQLGRFEQIAYTQADLDRHVRSLENTMTDEDRKFETDSGIDWWTRGYQASVGCGVEIGAATWPDAFFTEGATPQAALADLPDFVNACSVQPWVMSNERVATADRALGFCGCLTREIASAGTSQTQLDDLTRYYREEIGDAELDEADPNTLLLNDTASETCLLTFPRR